MLSREAKRGRLGSSERRVTYLSEAPDPFIQAANLLNDLSQVEIRLTQDLLKLKLATFELPPTRKGEKVRVPLWVARLLESEGLAAIDEEELVWLGKVHWREKVQSPRDTLSISILPKEFYPRVRNILHSLSAAPQDGYTRQRYRQAANLNRDVVRRRTHVIAELALLDTVDLSLMDKLTHEEKALLNRLRRTIRGWLKSHGGM